MSTRTAEFPSVAEFFCKGCGFYFNQDYFKNHKCSSFISYARNVDPEYYASMPPPPKPSSSEEDGDETVVEKTVFRKVFRRLGEQVIERKVTVPKSGIRKGKQGDCQGNFACPVCYAPQSHIKSFRTHLSLAHNELERVQARV